MNTLTDPQPDRPCPTASRQDQQTITIRLPRDFLRRLDRRRHNLPRAVFIREVLGAAVLMMEWGLWTVPAPRGRLYVDLRRSSF